VTDSSDSPDSADRSPSARGPLDGVVVADLSRVLAGPYCTMLLADLGATVVKVESPAGDETRTWRPPERDGVSTYYLSINRNKRSVVLDFGDPADLELAHELLRRADIAVQNFKPGGLARFGLDYESARSLNPGLVYVSISGFGSGAGASLPGYDLVVQAASGLMSLTGEPDGATYRAGVAVFDVMTGLHAFGGALAALHQRGITGEGQHVEVNLLSSALSGLVNQSGAYAAAGVVPLRLGNEHLSVYPYQTMPTADRDVVIATANDRQFRSLCEVLGIPEVADDPRFRMNADRTVNRGDLHPILLDALRHHTADELFEELNRVGVPCGPINTVQGGVELAERLGLQPLVDVGEGDRAVRLVRNPIDFSGASPRYDNPPPTLGEHTAEIKEWLRS
jgi:crotonobetainyl-CoA:carnitine CoA-transferase CaiB-like acyl-CoA transferase